MGRWKVDPEGLRAAASVFAGVAESNEGETTIAATGDVGDARLVSALSSFMEALIGGWMQRVSHTELLGLQHHGSVQHRAGDGRPR